LVVHTEFTTEWVIVLGLIVNFGERKVEIKRKVRDFDEDLQDKF
jgi:hypothetical protein